VQQQGTDAAIWTPDTTLPWLFAYTVALLLLVPPFYSYIRARRARGWPTVPGKVLRVSSEYDDGTISIDIEYEYRVDGVLLRGRRLRFGGGPYYRQKTVEALTARYPRGSSVEVRYDPSKPSLCVLDTRFEWLGWAPFFFFAIAILVPWTIQLFARFAGD
jgi:hypothetical protein